MQWVMTSILCVICFDAANLTGKRHNAAAVLTGTDNLFSSLAKFRGNELE
jgi:hypothetical protein